MINKKGIIGVVFLMLSWLSFGVVYTVDRGGGNINNGVGNTGSLAYVLNSMRGTLGPHTVNFTFTGVIDNTGGPTNWQGPWTVSVNNNGAPVSVANEVVFNGNGVTLSWNNYSGPDYGVHVLTISGSYVTLNNMNFINASDGSLAGYPNRGAGVIIADPTGISLPNKFTDVTFNNCSFNNNGGVGLFNSTFSTSNSIGVRRVFVNDCIATNNGLSGLQFSQADVVEIKGGDFSNNANHGIFFTGQIYKAGVNVPSNDLDNSIGVTNGLVTDGLTNITCNDNGNAGVIIEGNSTNNTIDNVTALRNQEHGLWLRLASSDNIIQNSTSSDNSGGELACGINVSLGGNKNNIIKDNTCSGNQNYGIYLYDNYGKPNDNNEIIGNTVTQNGSHGVYILNSTKTWVRNNTISKNGTDATQGRDGINFGNSSSDGEISGNEVFDNPGNGINITEGGDIQPRICGMVQCDVLEKVILAGGSNNNDVFDNYVGILRNGTISGNKQNGILIQKSKDNQVGVRGRNFVAGNTFNGVYLDNIPLGTTSIIQDNYIGTNLGGTGDEGNLLNGIFLENCKSVNIVGNLISGNDEDGIHLGNATSNNAADVVKIDSNIIGLNATGLAKIPNTIHGIDVTLASFVDIGTDSSNVISGNGQDGVNISNNGKNVRVYNNYIGFDITGKVDMGNGNIGINLTGANNGELIANYVGFNGSHGISITNALTKDNKVQSNVVGVVYNGATPSGNASNDGDGIHMENCINNEIGGSNNGGRLGNIIGYNTGHGVNVGDESENNKVYGNYIGINIDDTDIGNLKNGVILDGTSFNNKIGDDWRPVGQGVPPPSAATALTGNIISFNKVHGILVQANSGKTDQATYNTIKGNIIGLNTDRSSEAPNGEDGVRIDGGGRNTIGGVRFNGEMNFIAGRHKYQVHIMNKAKNNNVFGNSIGNNSYPTLAGAPTTFLADINSVYIEGVGTDSNLVGGINFDLGVPKLVTGNVIAQKESPAAVVIDKGARYNQVKSNFIGMQEDGKTPFGDLELAIVVQVGSNGNIIGGVNSGNLIGQTVKGTNATVGENDAIRILDSDSNSVNYNLIGVEFNKNTPVSGLGIEGKGIKVFKSKVTTVSHNIVGQVQNKNNAIDIFESKKSEVTYNQVGVGQDSTTALPNTFNGIYVSALSDSSKVKYNYVTNSAKHGIVDTNSTQTTLTHNESFENTLNGIYVSKAQISQLDSNIAYENGHNGILIDNLSHDTKTNKNTSRDNTLEGIYVTNCERVTLTSDTTFSNDLNGIRVDKASNTIKVISAVSNENNIHGIHISKSTDGLVDKSETNKNGLNGIPLGSGILVDTSSNNVTISENVSKENTLHGIHVFGIEGATITNDSVVENLLQGVFVDSIRVGNGITVNDNKAVKNTENGIFVYKSNTVGMTDNKVEENTLNGIRLYLSEDATLTTNEALKNQLSGILVDTNSHRVTTNTNNAYENEKHGIHILSIKEASSTKDIVTSNKGQGLFIDSLTTVSNITVTGTNATSNEKNGVLVRHTEKVKMSNSTSSDNLHNGIRVDSLSNLVELDGNTTKGNTLNGIYVTNITTATLKTNTSADNTLDGIRLDTVTTSATLESNILDNNSLNGIYVTNVKGVDIDKNQIGQTTGNANDGILVDSIGGVNTVITITENQVNKNTKNGIHVVGSGVTSLTKNVIGVNASKTGTEGNGKAGILLDQMDKPLTITDNLIGGNKNGIELQDASNLTITNNKIGTDALSNLGQLFGNSENGILVGEKSVKNTINGSNIIARNKVAITVDANNGLANRNTIKENHIFCNTDGDLGGIILTDKGNDDFLKTKMATNPLGIFTDGADQFLIIKDTAFAKTLRNDYTMNVYIKDETCNFCRQGETHQVELSIDSVNTAKATDPISGIKYNIPFAIDTVNKKDCGRFVYTLTDKDGNTSEFSSCSECIPPSCKKLTSDFVGITRDTTICGSKFNDEGTLLRSADLILTARDSAALADKNFRWFIDSTGTYEALANDDNTTFTIKQPKIVDSVRVVYQFYQTDLQECGITDTVTIHYAKKPKLAVGVDFNECETSLKASMGGYNSFVVEVNNFVTQSSTFVQNDEKIQSAWTILKGDGNFTLTGGGIKDTTATSVKYIAEATDVNDTLQFLFRGITYLPTGLPAPNDSTTCFLEWDTVDVWIVPTPIVEAGKPETFCAGEEVLLSKLTDQSIELATGMNWVLTDGHGVLSNPSDTATAEYAAHLTDDVGPTNKVTLTLGYESLYPAGGTLAPTAGCPGGTDAVELEFIASPKVDLAEMLDICEIPSVNPITFTLDDLQGQKNTTSAIVWQIKNATNNLSTTTGNSDKTYLVDNNDIGDTLRVVVKVEGTTTGKCQSVSDSTTFVINKQPTIDLGVNKEVCVGDSVASDLIVKNDVVTSWTTTTTPGANLSRVKFANGIPLVIDSALFYYKAVAGDVVNNPIKVEVTTNKNGVCPAATDDIEITVNGLPDPQLAGAKGDVCGDSIAEYEITNYKVPSTYTWEAVSADAGKISPTSAGDVQKVNFTYSNPNANTVYNSIVRVIEEDAKGCIDTVELAVKVEETKSFTIDLTTGAACEGKDITYSVTTNPLVLGNYEYQFDQYVKSTGLYTTDLTGDDTKANGKSLFETGDSVVVIVTSDYKCLDTNKVSANAVINLTPNPDLVLSSDATICSGTQTTISVVDNTPGTINTYKWIDENDNVIASSGTSQSIGGAGDYRVIAENDGKGCIDTSNAVTIKVKDPSIEATVSESVIFKGESVVVTGVGTNGTNASEYTWDWEPVNETVSTFNHTPDETTEYEATATLNSLADCKDVATVLVKVIEPLETFNVFTPHEDSGDADNVNDVWVIDHIQFYTDVSVKVYNRWGSIVYEYNGEGQGYFDDPWDGTRNGKAVPMAVYYYIVEGKILDIKETIQGHVSIVR